MSRKPRIVLDARPLSHPQPGGFRSYVRALLRGMAEREAQDDLELVVYVDRPLSPETVLPPGVQTRVLSPDRLKTDLRLFRSQILVDAPDLVHGTMNYLPALPDSFPTTLTLHDALGIKRDGWDAATSRTLRERFINRYWAYQTRVAARRARQIITVSHHAAREIAAALPWPPERLTVVYNGVFVPDAVFVEPREPGTILAIESPDPRKNVALLYRALSEFGDRFGATKPCLRIVCNGEGARRRALAALDDLQGLSGQLLTNLSDADLYEAYFRATVFAWPSRAEGFGLPPLEAMASGCAVVSSSAPAMPEILGDIPRYADPDDAAGFAEHLAQLLNNPVECQERGEQGRAHARAFTCRRMADETVAVWHRVLGTARP